jgi:hypothetical protein
MEKLIVEIGKQEKQPYDYSRIFKRFLTQWQSIVEKKEFFIPSKHDLWFEKVQGSDLISLLCLEPEYVKMVMHKNIGDPKTNEFPKHVYVAWEQHRNNLLTGIRKKFESPKQVQMKLQKR